MRAPYPESQDWRAKMEAWEGIFSQQDLRQLAQHGLDPEDVRAQLLLLENPPRGPELLRPCTVGDGIRRIGEEEARSLLSEHEAFCKEGGFVKFVPASGSATRMFASLMAYGEREVVSLDTLKEEARAGDPRAEEVLRFVEELESFPFFRDLIGSLSRDGLDLQDIIAHGRLGELVRRLLGPDHMGLGLLPKGLIGFHRYGREVRTPVEEHLVEACHYVRDSQNICRVHFTVSPGHLEGFREEIHRATRRQEGRLGVRFEVEVSLQDPSTDTIAVDLANRPFRRKDGKLLLRPGGHGALLRNLQMVKAPAAYIKNIDNVPREDLMDVVGYWNKVLGGLMVSLRREIFSLLEQLSHPLPSERSVRKAMDFARGELLLEIPRREDLGTTREAAREISMWLDRPLRVCAMVPNKGEPGGGPFWVKAPLGECGLQIVESAQVDMSSERQREIWNSSTHFNPVNMVCSLKDPSGKSYALANFADPKAVIITRKTSEGRELRALERPGLWNGGMAKWNTVFVEVPEETFHPVKTVLDLLRPGHKGEILEAPLRSP